VATTQLLPIYTKISQKILRKNGAQRLNAENDRVFGGNQYIIEGLDRFWLALRCPSHAWSWPRANQEERVQGFDSHQTCHKCLSRRMFNTQRWQVGPIYRHMARTDIAS
jgi:hypothetical protein